MQEPSNKAMTGFHRETFVDQFMSSLNKSFPETDQSPLAKFQRKRMKRALDLVLEGYSQEQALEILHDEGMQFLKVL